MKIKRFMICLIGLALLPIQAKAQPAGLEPKTFTGSRIPAKPMEMEPALLRQMQKDFSGCIYRRHPLLAKRLLLSSDPVTIDFGSMDIEPKDILEKFSMSDCLDKVMSQNQSEAMLAIDTRLLRPMLAEESYLDMHEGPLTITDDSPEFVEERLLFDSTLQGKARTLGAFSDCLVYQAPNEADALLRTRPASPNEAEAVKAIVPALSACIVEGQEVTLTPRSIRGLVADGLWTRGYYMDLQSQNSNTLEAAE